jgi:hypothetical protein
VFFEHVNFQLSASGLQSPKFLFLQNGPILIANNYHTTLIKMDHPPACCVKGVFVFFCLRLHIAPRLCCCLWCCYCCMSTCGSSTHSTGHRHRHRQHMREWSRSRFSMPIHMRGKQKNLVLVLIARVNTNTALYCRLQHENGVKMVQCTVPWEISLLHYDLASCLRSAGCLCVLYRY